eukprot:m.89074 g.89074  ORF g.89074 m.89074 type:complete len:269 (+) comp36592_c0_seq1:278-1084(+)
MEERSIKQEDVTKPRRWAGENRVGEWHVYDEDEKERMEARKRKQAMPPRKHPEHPGTKNDHYGGTAKKQKLVSDQCVGENAEGVVFDLEDDISQSQSAKNKQCDSFTQMSNYPLEVTKPTDSSQHYRCEQIQSLQYLQLAMATQLKSFEKHMDFHLSKFEDVQKYQTTLLNYFHAIISAKAPVEQNVTVSDGRLTSTPVILPGSVTSQQQRDYPPGALRPPPLLSPGHASAPRVPYCQVSSAAGVKGVHARSAVSGITYTSIAPALSK